jgi:hypothetical protein
MAVTSTYVMRVWCALVGMGVLGVFLALMIRSNAPDTVPLPLPEEVDQITAEIIDASTNWGIRPVQKFVVPERYFPVIFLFLSPAVKCRQSFALDGIEENWLLGRIELKGKNGVDTSIAIYEAGKNRLIFSVNGVRCMRGGEYQPIALDSNGYEAYAAEQNGFASVLFSIRAAADTGNEPSELNRHIEAIKRSRGELPPEIWPDRPGN